MKCNNCKYFESYYSAYDFDELESKDEGFCWEHPEDDNHTMADKDACNEFEGRG